MKITVVLYFLILLLTGCSQEPSSTEDILNLVIELGKVNYDDKELVLVVPPNSCISCKRLFVEVFDQHQGLCERVIFLTHKPLNITCNGLVNITDPNLRMFDLKEGICNLTIAYINSPKSKPICLSEFGSVELTNYLLHPSDQSGNDF